MMLFSLLTQKESLVVAVMNLVSGVDTQAIEAEIADYQKQNAELIMLNQAKRVLHPNRFIHSFSFFNKFSATG